MLREYLVTNIKELKKVVNEINSYDGSLDHLRVYENDDDFFETFFQGNIRKALDAVLYGDFNSMDPYVKFDGYENLETLNNWEYKELLINNVNDIITELINKKDFLDLNEEIKTLIEE